MKMQKLMEGWRRYLKEAEEVGSKPKLYFLIGPPAVGKSYWIKRNIPNVEAVEHRDPRVISRDEIVTDVSKGFGMTYDDFHMVKAPAEIKPQGMLTKEMLRDPSQQDKVEEYINLVAQAAESFNKDPNNAKNVKRFGKLKPFSREDFEKVLFERPIGYDVPPERVLPFSYEKIDMAQKDVAAKLDLTRKSAVTEKRMENKDLILDMTSLTLSERNGHRKTFLSVIEDIKPQDANPIDINKYYEQIAIVFAPSEQGYDEETRKKIKLVAKERSAELAAQGESKTIPDNVYDRMFPSFEAPTEAEGFSVIKYVGIPSFEWLDKLEKNSMKENKLTNSLLRKLIKEEIEKINEETLQGKYGLGHTFTTEELINTTLEYANDINKIYNAGGSSVVEDLKRLIDNRLGSNVPELTKNPELKKRLKDARLKLLGTNIQLKRLKHGEGAAGLAQNRFAAYKKRVEKSHS